MSARYVLMLAGLMAFVPSSAQALELKNVRPAYGFLGATRQDMKFLPGDFLFVPARAEHRFLDFTDDFTTWVLFYGAEGGE